MPCGAVPGPTLSSVRLAAATQDPVVTDAFLRVAGLVEDPMSLMRPDIAVRVGRVMQHMGRQPAATSTARD